jgi:hypothetical protein
MNPETQTFVQRAASVILGSKLQCGGARRAGHKGRAAASTCSALSSRLSGANALQCRVNEPTIRCACEIEEP